MMDNKVVEAGPVEVLCSECRTTIYLPVELYQAARKSDKIWFCCPYGHVQHFPEKRAVDRLIENSANVVKLK